MDFSMPIHYYKLEAHIQLEYRYSRYAGSIGCCRFEQNCKRVLCSICVLTSAEPSKQVSKSLFKYALVIEALQIRRLLSAHCRL